MTYGYSRRDTLGAAAGFAATLTLPAFAAETPIKRPIPHSGEMIPVVGLGTAQAFNDAADAKRQAALAEVIARLTGDGGRLVDTASTYGGAEELLGAVLAAASPRPDVFIATKIEATEPKSGEAELRQSLARLRVKTVDCVQLHNVRDPAQSLAMFREFKAAGLLRYFGVTSTRPRDYAALEAVITREKPDFMEVGYSIGDREAEERLLPAAAAAGTAVLTALPLGRNSLFRQVKGKPLPAWVADLEIATWGQYFLKYLLGHPAVTVVIPGTENAAHMADDLAAGRGPLPNETQRRRMLQDFLAA